MSVPSSFDPSPELVIQAQTFIEQQYHLTGSILSAEAALEQYGIPANLYNHVLTSCREALEEKGVSFKSLAKEDDWTTKSLTPLQLLVANSLLDFTDTRSEKKKLQDLGVHTQTYNAWLKDPAFKDYLAQRAKQMLGDNEHQVDLALLDKVRSGDIKAIAYYNEMTGRFVQQRANSSQVDIQNVLVKVIEIISEEVTNVEDAKRISNRLKAMISARNIAGALTSPEEPISVPEVVEIRQIEA